MLINNDTYQRETVSERPIRQALIRYFWNYRLELNCRIVIECVFWFCVFAFCFIFQCTRLCSLELWTEIVSFLFLYSVSNCFYIVLVNVHFFLLIWLGRGDGVDCFLVDKYMLKFSNKLLCLAERLTIGKNEKEYSWHFPAMKFIGIKQLVLKVANILEKLRFTWICGIWGNFVKIWYFVNYCLIEVRI